MKTDIQKLVESEFFIYIYGNLLKTNSSNIYFFFDTKTWYHIDGKTFLTCDELNTMNVVETLPRELKLFIYKNIHLF